MSRRHQQMVEVERRDEAPARFWWKGRCYGVLAVLDSWVETRPWWLGLAGHVLVVGDEIAAGDGGDPAAEPGGPGAGFGGTECRYFRVEAAPGAAPAAAPRGEPRSGRRPGVGRPAAVPLGCGVFDLCFDWSCGQWQLTRVFD